jgi:hypothetical protein
VGHRRGFSTWPPTALLLRGGRRGTRERRSLCYTGNRVAAPLAWYVRLPLTSLQWWTTRRRRRRKLRGRRSLAVCCRALDIAGQMAAVALRGPWLPQGDGFSAEGAVGSAEGLSLRWKMRGWGTAGHLGMSCIGGGQRFQH